MVTPRWLAPAKFDPYLALESKSITRAFAEQRMPEKLTRSLTEDIGPLLPTDIRFNDDDAMMAFDGVWRQLIVHINGDAWKLTDKVFEGCARRDTSDCFKASEAVASAQKAADG